MKKFLIQFSIFITLVIIIILVYGFKIGPNTFKTKEVRLSLGINDNFNGLKVVHLSDIYYGNSVDKKFLKKIADEINLINPDILVITGDTFIYDYASDEINELVDIFNSMNAKLGKYIISGDKDNLDALKNIISKTNFNYLDNTYTYIYSNDSTPILLVGISDSTEENLHNATKEIPLDINFAFKILLMHKPDGIDTFDHSSYNLVLSGHSLGGISLFGKLINLPDGAKKYPSGEYKLGHPTLYVSNGLGVDNVRFRFMNKPSINFYRIIK